MTRSTEEIIHDYYITLQDAAKSKILNAARLHLADDVVYIGPEGRVEGKHQLMKLFQDKLIPGLSKLSIQHQIFDKASGCTIFDWVNATPHTTHRFVEVHRVKNGVIYEIQRFVSPRAA